MDWNDEDMQDDDYKAAKMRAWVDAVLNEIFGDSGPESDPGEDPEPESWTCPGLDTPAPALPPIRHRITDLSAFLLRYKEEGDE